MKVEEVANPSEARMNIPGEVCTCFGAGNGMKWFNPTCRMHGFNRKLPEDMNIPKMSKEMEQRLKDAFKDFKNK